jgi:hypothetical protein
MPDNHRWLVHLNIGVDGRLAADRMIELPFTPYPGAVVHGFTRPEAPLVVDQVCWSSGGYFDVEARPDRGLDLPEADRAAEELSECYDSHWDWEDIGPEDADRPEAGETMLLAEAELNELVAIFLESNPEATLEQATEFCSWANNTRFMSHLLEMILERKAKAFFLEGEMRFGMRQSAPSDPDPRLT